MGTKTIIIGDVHGCLEELEELLKIASFDRGSDEVVLLGDLIDRGPDSLGVVRKAQEIRARCVFGNHENNFYKWLRAGKSSKGAKDFYYKLSDKDIDFLRGFARYIENGNFVFLHAGLRGKIPLHLQDTNDIIHIRFIDLSGRFISLKKIKKVGKKEAKAHFWTEFWKGPQSVVYGHHATSQDSPLIEMVAPGVTCYGLDTGCCFGGKLTGMILETKEIIQVKAKQEYHQSRFTI